MKNRNMRLKQEAQKVNRQIKDFLKKNPAIKESLRVFDISYEQYQKSLEENYNFYTDFSTSPKGPARSKNKKG